MQCSVERFRRRTGAQIVLPGGDVAAAPTSAPSLGFQSSAAPAPARRHTASAPPRDARYTNDESDSKRGAAARAVGTSMRVGPCSAAPTETVQSCAVGFETV